MHMSVPVSVRALVSEVMCMSAQNPVCFSVYGHLCVGA